MKSWLQDNEIEKYAIHNVKKNLLFLKGVLYNLKEWNLQIFDFNTKNIIESFDVTHIYWL